MSLDRLRSVAYKAPAGGDRVLSSVLGMQIAQEADTEAACWRDSSANAVQECVLVNIESAREIERVLYTPLGSRGVAVGGVENPLEDSNQGFGSP